MIISSIIKQWEKEIKKDSEAERIGNDEVLGEIQKVELEK